MKSLSDDILMAYADGELSGVEARGVEVFLEQSADGRRRLEVFASTRAALSGMFDQPMNEPVPQHLVDAIKAMPIGRAAGSNVVPFAAAKCLRSATPVAAPRFALAAAACVSALVVSAGAMWLLQGKPGSQAGADMAVLENGVLVATAVLAERLDLANSGQPVALTVIGTSGSLKPVFTFATASKQFCRQYEITGIGQGATTGVACRQDSGRWRIEFQGTVAAEVDADGKVRPAEGRAGDAPVDAAVDRLISGDPISADAERALISNGWHATTP